MSIKTGQSGTFFYTPDISVVVNTKSGPVDISADVVDFNLQRQINAVSTFSCTLNNPGFKYNYDGGSTPISTMDRIVVFLKRTSYVQVFTGFVTYAPLVTLIPTPIQIQATCTLRILQSTYWDDTLIQFQNLLLNYMDSAAQSSNSTLNDGGIAQAVVNVLYNVCNWNPKNIHIQGIPNSFINFTAQVYSNLISSANGLDQNSVKELSKIISAAGVSSGQNAVTTNSAGVETLTNNQAPDGGIGTTISVSQAKPFITTGIGGNPAYFPGPSSMNPVNSSLITEDIYYCSAPFSYLNLQNQTEINNAKTWLAQNHVTGKNDGRLLLLINQRYNKVVAVRTTSVPQKTTGKNNQAIVDKSVDYFQVHPGVIAYLTNNANDPKSYDPKNATSSMYSEVTYLWADQTIVNVGPQNGLDSKLIQTNASVNSQDVLNNTAIVNSVISNMRTQVGHTKYVYGGKTPGVGFDCSGLVQWAWNTEFKKRNVNASLNANTNSQFGSLAPSDKKMVNGPVPLNNQTLGTYFGVNAQPQAGDALYFYNMPKAGGDNTPPPNHVATLSIDFGQPGPNGERANPDQGWYIAAQTNSGPLKDQIVEQPIYWSHIVGGYNNKKAQSNGSIYLGARRPLSLFGGATTTLNSNSSNNGSYYNANDPSQRSALNLSNAFNTLFQAPQFDVRASVVQGSPRAFLLDNPVMQDITQIMGAGLRLYQSAPNGDFVAWFPDYYGIYGTDPVMDISPVEIMDFQIYHDDNQLATHVGVIGDTTGIGQQVSFQDYITTNGIVSIQDTSTMEILFGTYLVQNNTNNNATGNTPTSTNLKNVLTFLNRYGMRPMVQEQSVIHSHAIEYLYALQQFMLQWVNQFVSTVDLTFMPELYPGMRIKIAMDQNNIYHFYVMGVTHHGSRSGGFTTQVQLTAPMKGNNILHYGLDLVPNVIS